MSASSNCPHGHRLVWSQHEGYRTGEVSGNCGCFTLIYDDKAPVCQCEFVKASGVVLCDNPAAWWGVSLCCGQKGFYCDSCKRRADGHGDYRYTLELCAECGGRGISWTKLSDVSPAR